jgi:GDP-mannose 6-dehydrogenase
MGVEWSHVMRLFCLDTKLNVSSTYLRPGFAFGGSCLPKDVRDLTYQGRLLAADTSVSDRSSRAPRSTSLIPCL